MSPREALEYLIASIIYMYIWRCYESQARRWKEAEGGDRTCEDAKERRFLLIKLFPLECLTRRL